MLAKFAFPDYTFFIFFAVLIGAAAGLAAVFFHNSIEFFNTVFFEQTTEGLFFLGTAAVIILPAIGMLIQSVMITFAPGTSRKKGVSEVIKATALRGGVHSFPHNTLPFFCPGNLYWFRRNSWT